MDLTATVRINAPGAEVFAFLAEPSNNPLWQNGMRQCEWITDPPHGVGSQYRQEASFLGKTVVSVFRVVDYEAGATMAIETIESTFPIQVRRSVADNGHGTCTVFAAIGGGPHVPKLFAGLLGRLAQRSVTKDYERLAARFGP